MQISPKQFHLKKIFTKVHTYPKGQWCRWAITGERTRQEGEIESAIEGWRKAQGRRGRRSNHEFSDENLQPPGKQRILGNRANEISSPRGNKQILCTHLIVSLIVFFSTVVSRRVRGSCWCWHWPCVVLPSAMLGWAIRAKKDCQPEIPTNKPS